MPRASGRSMKAHAAATHLQLEPAVGRASQFERTDGPQVGTHPDHHVVRNTAAMNELAAAPNLVDVRKGDRAGTFHPPGLFIQHGLRVGNLRPRVARDINHVLLAQQLACSKMLGAEELAHLLGVPCSVIPHIGSVVFR